MASQAAARGLRTATSKHILLDKLKVPLEFSLLPISVPWCKGSFDVVVASGEGYYSCRVNGCSLTESVMNFVNDSSAVI